MFYGNLSSRHFNGIFNSNGRTYNIVENFSRCSLVSQVKQFTQEVSLSHFYKLDLSPSYLTLKHGRLTNLILSFETAPASSIHFNLSFFSFFLSSFSLL